MRKGLPSRDIEREMYNRHAFLDFLKGLLNINPLERWSPLQAIQHPFITGEKFTGPYIPSLRTMNPIFSQKPGVISEISPGKPSGKSVISMFHNRRPRANTISSSKVQNVPPQLQRLIAAQQLQGSSKFPHSEAAERMRDLPQSQNSNTSLLYDSFSPNNINYDVPQIGNLIRTQSQIQEGTGPMGSQNSLNYNISGNNPSFNNSQIEADSSMSSDNSALYGLSSDHSHYVTDGELSLGAPDIRGNFGPESYDNMPSEVMPRRGATGERSNIPSRIPSSATSAEWEIFNDLDNQGPFYHVSGSSSVATSQQPSRQSSMMDIAGDYFPAGSGYHNSNLYLNNQHAKSEQGDMPMNDANAFSNIERKYSQGSSGSRNQRGSFSLNNSGSSLRYESYSTNIPPQDHQNFNHGQRNQPSVPQYEAKRHSINQAILSTSWAERAVTFQPREKVRSRRATHYDSPTNLEAGLHNEFSTTQRMATISMPENFENKARSMEKRRFSESNNSRHRNQNSQSKDSKSTNTQSSNHENHN